jgi:hypothetical protein
LCEALSGRRVEYAEIANADLVAIGSLLEPHFFQRGSWDEYSGAVWGTGRMFGDRDKLRLTKAHVAALRGRLMLENVILSERRDVPLGDPVLLCARLGRPLRKRYKLGLVPHQTEYNHPLVRHFADRSPDITVIDVCGGVQNVIDQIGQCEFLLSRPAAMGLLEVHAAIRQADQSSHQRTLRLERQRDRSADLEHVSSGARRVSEERQTGRCRPRVH